MTEGNRRKVASKPKPGLYVIPTPIGNLRDITLRALDILEGVDLIACEDTRVTSRLLNAYQIKTPMIAYHDHNAGKVRPRLLEQLTEGGSIALVSDAGTPLISDPGYKLLRHAIDVGLDVIALPGPSAVLTGLLAAGLPTDRFLFAGFPPNRTIARQKFLTGFASYATSLIFFESPKRLARSLADMASVFGEREGAIARELTKMFEEVQRGTLKVLAQHYAALPSPKGEIVIIVGPPLPAPAPSPDAIDTQILAALELHGIKSAADLVSEALNLPRRDIYQRALKLRGNG
jgi:16S rRNA (cytidine1402-2'-O)-methyltransferase